MNYRSSSGRKFKNKIIGARIWHRSVWNPPIWNLKTNLECRPLSTRRTLNVFPWGDIVSCFKTHPGRINDAIYLGNEVRSDESPWGRGSQQIGELGRQHAGRCWVEATCLSIYVYRRRHVWERKSVCVCVCMWWKPPNSFGRCKDAVGVTH